MSDTLYPHLDKLLLALETLGLETPIEAFASLKSISIQGSPQVSLVAGDTTVKQTIGSGRVIQSWNMVQEWTVAIILRDSSDQRVTSPLLAELGTWQARVLNVLMRDVIGVGGPINLIEIPEPEAIAGGALAGRIKLGIQFVFTSE
ncbi:MAG: hypothetical protein ABTS22_22560 [Accumulibacter sp.]|uniref:hypothetical protein n=1 Tax=Accumulibacter sp. TaxID=2053492 RepID=UPI00331482C5